MKVSVFYWERLVGERTVFDPSDVPIAADSVMVDEHLDHCAVRFEDSEVKGWMLIGTRDGVFSGLLDVPIRHREKVRDSNKKFSGRFQVGT